MSREIFSSNPLKLQSNGQMTLTADGSYVQANEMRLTTPLAVAQGGVGASNASSARSNLGLVIGSDVQAHNARLDQLSIAAASSNQYVKFNGSELVFATLPAGTNYNGDEVSITEADNVFSVKDAGISSDKLASGAVVEAKIANGAVSVNKLASGSVSSAKLASSVVSSGEGLLFNSGALKVDSAVVCMLSGNQEVDGVKSFLGRPKMYQGLSSESNGDGLRVDNFVSRSNSSSDTPITMSFPCDADSVSQFSILVSCSNSDLSKFGSWTVSGCTRRVGSAGCSSGALHYETVFKSDNALSVVPSVSGNNLVLTCSGIASTDIKWGAEVKQLSLLKYV